VVQQAMLDRGWCVDASRALARRLVLAGLMAAAVMQGAPAVRAASVLPATDAALVPPSDPPPEAAGQTDADVKPSLDPAALLREIDLLLDLQIDAVDLGATPADGPAAGGLAGAVDLNLLSPGLPANPLFPGYGLSYVLPAGPGRVGVDELHPVGSDGSAARRWSSGASGWFGLDADGRLSEPIGEVRAWIAAHRTALLIGLGLVALAVAAATSITARAARARHHSSPRRRRRRSSRSSGSGAAHGGDSTGHMPGPGDGGRPALPRGRRPSADPVHHQR